MVQLTAQFIAEGDKRPASLLFAERRSPQSKLTNICLKEKLQTKIQCLKAEGPSHAFSIGTGRMLIIPHWASPRASLNP